MSNLQQLKNEQARAYICSDLGHSWKFILPVQKRDKSREVLSACATCRQESWIQLPPKGYKQFLKDLADGKIEQKEAKL